MSKEIESYRNKQRKAVETMLEEEKKSLELLAKDEEWNKETTAVDGIQQTQTSIPEGSVGVYSPVTGRIWDITVSLGEFVGAEKIVASVEAMKMECPCVSPASGIVTHILIAGRQLVQQGDLIIILIPHKEED